MKAILLNPPKRRSGKGRRRHARRSKQAAAWRKHLRNQAGTWIPAFKNPKRKGSRRRRKNATFDYGTAFTKKSNRSGRRRSNQAGTWIPAFKNNPYWVPRYAQNPGSGGAVGSLTKGLKPAVLLETVPLVGGALGNALLSSWLKTVGFIPGALKSGLGGNVLELASAGLLGAGVGLVSPKYAGSVFMGAVADVLISFWNTQVKAKLGMHGMGNCIGGCDGMDGYLTTQDAANATPLNGMSGIMEETDRLPNFDLPSDVAPYDYTTLV